jgi:1,4-dihydroxy-2-naphthoate octaprenyltransferase
MLRLPFLSVSVLPYIFGGLIAAGRIDPAVFALGLFGVASAHLAANLANDYGDAQSGADDRDPTHYGFFGGAKLIQEGVLTPRFTAFWASVFGLLALIVGGAAVAVSGRVELLVLLAVGVGLGLSYTLPPLKLGYRRLGEAAVFLLFGPVCVAAGAGLQGAPLSAPSVWLVSLPFGFLAASVLAANEVPDAMTDTAAGKETLVTALGPSRGHVIYSVLVAAAACAVGVSVAAGLLHWAGLFIVALAPMAWKASAVLRERYDQKRALLAASGSAAAVHGAGGAVLILAGIL